MDESTGEQITTNSSLTMEDHSTELCHKKNYSRTDDCVVRLNSDICEWKDEEKNLFNQGFKLFGPLPSKISEVVKTKSPDEVENYLLVVHGEQHWPDGSESETHVPSTSKCVNKKTIVTCTAFECSKTAERGVVKASARTKFKHGKRNSLSDKNKEVVERSIQAIQGSVVKIEKKQSSDTDEEIEIDVEIQCDSDNQKITFNTDFQHEGLNSTICRHSEKQIPNVVSITPSHACDPSFFDQLSSLDTPKNELLLENNFMNDLEKMVYKDLLNSPEEKSQHIYLELRNHIVSKWHCKKPNYVTKTDIRKDLNKPIDNKVLGKIHSFLEQIGAINYGCGRVKYMRPMQKFIDCLCMKNQDSPQSKRCRKKRFLNNGEGGCTVSHGINGEIIDTMIINEDQPHPKKRVRKKPIYLIYCQPFNQRNGYHLQLHISALLLMDFHAHSSLSEVMGLIGGSWCCDTKTLAIKHYEPCKNAASSVTHCDMCPISQATSAEKIHNLNMDLLGWFHSHPMFPPEPSQQDLETQQDFQECIGYDKPVIGIILAPFYRRDVLFPSDYRCIIVEKSKSDCGYVPYKFKVDIRCNDFDVDRFLENMSKIYHTTSNRTENKSDFNFKNPYIHDANITYMDKFISSARMTLEKYISDVNVRTKVLKGIQDICKNI